MEPENGSVYTPIYAKTHAIPYSDAVEKGG
jgi:hypothetical protein